MEEEIAKLDIEYSYVAAFGTSMDHLQDSRLVIENNIVVTPGLNTALHCCFAAYWVFDIKYPACARNILLFLESLVYKLPTSQRMPTTVVTMIESISRIHV